MTDVTDVTLDTGQRVAGLARGAALVAGRVNPAAGTKRGCNRTLARPSAGVVRGGESRRTGGEQVGVSFLARPAADDDGGSFPAPPSQR